MSEQDQIALLTEIRDLQRRQLEVTQQSLSNQALSLANQYQVLQQQVTNRAILVKTRKWTLILLSLLVLAAFLYLLQPLLLIWLAQQRYAGRPTHMLNQVPAASAPMAAPAPAAQPNAAAAPPHRTDP
jgi:hypothetical protein